MRLFFGLLTLVLTNYGLAQSPSIKEDLKTTIIGQLALDNIWEPSIYLSHIPDFDRRFEINNQMIIAKTAVDSLGKFALKIDFLPADIQLYRLHIVKKGDSPASLIIGGQNENHLFLVLNNESRLTIQNDTTLPPFKNVSFTGSEQNRSFNSLVKLYEEYDFRASISNSSTRKLINEQLSSSLLAIADSSQYILTALYATYLHKNMSGLENEKYADLVDKWKGSNSTYLSTLIVIDQKKPSIILYLLGIGGIAIALFIGFKQRKKYTNRSLINELSIQERKVFALLREGKTNQEISDECNVAVSTVKSHVSSIYGKLKISSRKEAMNYKE